MNNPPSILVFFSSFRCNARCVMCSAWVKQKTRKELNCSEVERIFSDVTLSKSIKVINLTGGEPTLREDLVEIVKIIAAKCVNLERLDLSTNGITGLDVIDKIEQILAYLLPRGLKLSASLSIDGVGEVHDRVRGTPGAFNTIDGVIKELRELMRLYANFTCGVNTTINKLNYKSLEEILNYCRRNYMGINFTLSALSEIGVESLLVEDNFGLKQEEKNVVSGFFEKLLETGQLNLRYGRFMLSWLKEGRRLESCSFRSGRSLLCEPDGSIYACGNFKDFKLGNLLEDSYKNMAASKRGFAKIYKAKCSNCNSNCYF
ncbi:MAG: radical SAM protein [Candidatus Omnitrophota bacterium]